MVLKESEAGKVSQQPWRMFRSKNAHTWNWTESKEQNNGKEVSWCIHGTSNLVSLIDIKKSGEDKTQRRLCFLGTLKICTDSKVLSHKAARDLQKRWQCKMELAQIFVPQRQAVNLDRQLTCCGVCMTISLLTSLDSVSFIQGMHDCLPPWSRLIVFPRIPPHLSPFRYHFQ